MPFPRGRDINLPSPDEEAAREDNLFDLADDDGTVYTFERDKIKTKKDFLDQVIEKRRAHAWLTDPNRHTAESSSFDPPKPVTDTSATWQDWKEKGEGLLDFGKSTAEFLKNTFTPRVPEAAIESARRLATNEGKPLDNIWNAGVDIGKSMIPGYQGLEEKTRHFMDQAGEGDAKGVAIGAGEEAANIFSPVPLRALWNVGHGAAYAAGLTDTPISPREVNLSGGQLMGAVGLAGAHSAGERIKAGNARERVKAEQEAKARVEAEAAGIAEAKANAKVPDAYSEEGHPYGEEALAPPWVDPAHRASILAGLDYRGQPIPDITAEPHSMTYVEGGEPGATEKSFPGIEPTQPAADTLLAAAMRMSRNPEQLLYPPEKASGFGLYAERDAAIRAEIAAENARRDSPTPESIRRFMTSSTFPQQPAEPGSTRMGFDEGTAASKDIETFNKNRGKKGAPIKGRGEMVPGLPEGPDAALYRTIPESLWPRRSQTWLEAMTPERFKVEPEPTPEPSLPEITTAPNVKRMKVSAELGPLAEGGVLERPPEVSGPEPMPEPAPGPELPSVEPIPPPRLALQRPLDTGFGPPEAIQEPPPMGEVTPEFPGQPVRMHENLPSLEPPPSSGFSTGSPQSGAGFSEPVNMPVGGGLPPILDSPVSSAATGRGGFSADDKSGSFTGIVDDIANSSLDPDVKAAAATLKADAPADPSMVGQTKEAAKDIGGLWGKIGQSNSHRLKSLGPAGAEIDLTARKIDADAAGFAGGLSADLTRASEGMSKEQITQAHQVIEGKAKTTDMQVRRYIDVYKANEAKLLDLMRKSGSMMKSASGKLVPFKALANYFPHIFEKGFFEENRTKIINQIAAERKITFSQAENLLQRAREHSPQMSDSLHERTANIQGYKTGIDVMHQHYLDLAERAFTDQHFGVNDTSGVGTKINQLIDQVGAESGAEGKQMASDIVKKYLGKGELNVDKGVNRLTKFQAMTKLALSAPSNLMGGLTASFARAKGSLVPEIIKAFTKDGKLRAQELGSLESVMKDAAEDIGYGSKISWGNTSVENFLRTVSGLAGEKTANKFFQQLKQNPDNAYAAARLSELTLEKPETLLAQDSLTEMQTKRAASRFTDLTQGRQNPLDLPHAWSNSPTANLLTQFKKYAFIQSKNIKDAMILDLSHGKINPTLKLAIASGVLGEVPADIKELLRHGTLAGRPSNLALRYVDNASQAYGIGLIGDAVHTAASGDMKRGLGQLAGPSIDTALDLSLGVGESGWNAAQDIAAGNLDKDIGAPLTRAVVRQGVPIWGRQLAKEIKGF